MAYIDDRVWCHPKFTDLTDKAFATWVRSVAYSAGMLTRGTLTAGQQKMVGADAKVRRELVQARLWDTLEDGETVYIHDWKEHNEKRDDRRQRDRDRKRLERASPGTSRGQSAGRSPGQSAGTSNGPAHADPGGRPSDRRALTSEGSEEDQNPRAVTSTETPRERPPNGTAPDHETVRETVAHSLAATDDDIPF